MNIEPRTDCESFEAKRWTDDCGDCQTDGHYLCAGCRHIAPFDGMELQDNRLSYYHRQELARIEAETWILVTDRLPAKEGVVIAWDDDSLTNEKKLLYRDQKFIYAAHGVELDYTPTISKWRPLS